MSQMIADLLDAGVPEPQIERLITGLGGLPMYVPAGDTAATYRVLVEQAGAELAAAMARLYGGCTLTIPLGHSWRRARQVAEVARLRRDGLSAAQIARRLHLHMRQVQRLQAQGRSDAEPTP